MSLDLVVYGTGLALFLAGCIWMLVIRERELALLFLFMGLIQASPLSRLVLEGQTRLWVNILLAVLTIGTAIMMLVMARQLRPGTRSTRVAIAFGALLVPIVIASVFVGA